MQYEIFNVEPFWLIMPIGDLFFAIPNITIPSRSHNERRRKDDSK